MKNKNALRKHFVAPWTSDDKKPSEDDYLPLAANIQSIEDDSDEDTEDSGFYDGDGSKETTINGRTEKWKVSGYNDPDDKAQALIAGMRRNTTDDGRKLWHKIVNVNGEIDEGIAKAMDIKAGGGDATDYEAFECSLNFVSTPTVTPKDTTPAG